MTFLQLEEFGLNAWPALYEETCGGWVLRYADGYTKRANSAQPLYASDMPLEQQIDACEQFYAARNLPSIVRLTSCLAPPALDSLLEQRGYELRDPSMVMTCTLSERSHAGKHRVELRDESVLDNFLQSYERMNGTSTNRQAHGAILLAVKPKHHLYRVWLDGQELACAFVVYEAGFVGLFDIAVHPDLRGRGVGTALIETLLTVRNPPQATPL